ncbi:MAG TPA: mycofactocin-coupled SDR family oxidoreductase [Acidimicrobiia bacterium]|jgi:SDR family mycofactocin-dependent oxidoreductase
MGLLDGKVAFISGGARGQGRSHAVRLAEEGADIITFDICEPMSTQTYAGATEDDLAETVKLVEERDRRIVARKADVRDQAAVEAVLAEGVAEFGRVDIVLANAGVMSFMGEPSQTVAAWQEAIDVMLTGVFFTCEAAIPHLIEQGQGGSIVITSSLAGLRGPLRTMDMKSHGGLGYFAAKHGVIGLMRCYANLLGPHSVRVNTVHPTGVNTPMVANPEFMAYATEHPGFMEAMRNALPVMMIEAEDVSNAILFLCSDAGRFITGVTFPVDAGAANY